MAHVVVATAYGGPDGLRLVEQDAGEPGPGQVLLEVHAVGVNPADWKQYSGAWGTDPAKLPMRLGHEAAGVVRAVGPGVELAVGDEVIAYPAPGAYASALVVRADSLVTKPATMSWEKAAGLMVAGVTAAHTLAATAVGAGDTVLVHGAAGGVGAVVVQLARARGARVIGTAAPENHDYLTDLGAMPVRYGPGLVDRVRALALRGVDAAIDTAGTMEALEASVELVADRGRIATIAGFEHGARLGVRMLGGGAGADPGTDVRRAARGKLVALWSAGRLDVRVGATYPLRDVAKAHRAGIAGTVKGKIVLLPGH